MQEKNPLSPPSISLIGYDSGWGCRDFRCEDGPSALALDQLLHQLGKQGVSAHWKGFLGLKHLDQHLPKAKKEQTLNLVHYGLQKLSLITYEETKRGRIPVVVGGDHTSAAATWAGIVAARGAHQTFGLIWIDAHMDSHTYETSAHGKFGGWWHGQPLSALMGHGLQALTHIAGSRPKLSPAHISLIGIHSYEPEEAAFLRRMGVRVYFLQEVKERGFDAVFKEALARATNGTQGFGLSLDIDVFHPRFAPGVGSEEEDGLIPDDVLPSFTALANTAGFAGLEVAELNPHKDINRKTARLAEKIIEEIFRV